MYSSLTCFKAIDQGRDDGATDDYSMQRLQEYLPPENITLPERILQSLNSSLTRQKTGRRTRIFTVSVSYIVLEFIEEFLIFHGVLNYFRICPSQNGDQHKVTLPTYLVLRSLN
jgi:hypothetical protein